MGILSVQSQVASGYVGNSAAGFALRVRGHEVWEVPTVLLSHHPGHGGARGGPVAEGVMRGLVEGLAGRGILGRCEAVVSGDVGSAGAGGVVREAVGLARAMAPGAVFLCDPVMGDEGRRYVSPEIAMEAHNLAALADIITPNAFELSDLTGCAMTDRRDAMGALRAAQGMGPRVVVLTSFEGRDTGAGLMDVIVADEAAIWRASVPKLGQKFSGAGDLFAAVFLSVWLESRNSCHALGAACAGVQAVLRETVTLGLDELALVQARHQLTLLPPFFALERLG